MSFIESMGHGLVPLVAGYAGGARGGLERWAVRRLIDARRRFLWVLARIGMPQVVGSGRDFGRGPDCDWRLEGRSAPTSGRSQRATTTSASGVDQKFWYWDACRVLDGYPRT